MPLQALTPCVVHVLVQHCAEPASPQHAPPVHGPVLAVNAQPFESEEHVMKLAAPPVQLVPVTGHWGSALQTQAAPEQLWCGPHVDATDVVTRSTPQRKTWVSEQNVAPGDRPAQPGAMSAHAPTVESHR